MKLTCFVQPNWRPRIRPASLKRPWMDETPEAYAYRCLPLNIANTHGWEVLSPCAFSVMWNGSADASGLTIKTDEAEQAEFIPVSLFGNGVLTFHVEGLIRTPPGYNLWVSGPSNAAKDGIAPLSGAIETDWSPYTFTMNWKLTRPGHWVEFAENEPFCFFFPIERKLIEAVEPQLAPMADDPELKAQFESWSESRIAFHRKMEEQPPSRPGDRWQKLYYRGQCPNGGSGAADHQSKLRVKPFMGLDGKPLMPPEPPPPKPRPAHAEPAPLEARRWAWLADAQERQRSLSRIASAVHARRGLGADTFLNDYYAPGRPLVLVDEMTGWPALRWSREHLVEALGSVDIEIERGRSWLADARSGERSNRAFARFAGPSKDAHGFATVPPLGEAAGLAADVPIPDKFVAASVKSGLETLSFAQDGAVTHLHQRRRNLLIAQINGGERVTLYPPSESARLQRGTAPGGVDNWNAAPRRIELELSAGEMLFVPIGWWLASKASGFGASITFTEFRWANDFDRGYPAD